MKSYLKIPPTLLEKWQHLLKRDRQMLLALGIFLIGVVSYSGLWQPAHERLAAAERLFQQRLALAIEVHRALPGRQRHAALTPLSTQLNDSAAAQGLDMQHFEVEDNVLRMRLRGDAITLLRWLDSVERDGAMVEALSLEKSDLLLEVQLVVRSL